MKKTVGRVLLTLLIVFSILTLTGGLLIPSWISKRAKRSYPQIQGEMEVEGLTAPVEVIRDSHGVPHIYGQTHHDLFFAQGWVHAQDRFWQMDMWRHQGAGRLSELLGGSTLETDKFLRTLGWERVTKSELKLLDQEEHSILEAYSAGVNAYIEKRAGIDLGLEYTFLPLLNRGYQPQPWTPLHSLTWAKAMAWDLRRNMDTEIDRALLLNSLSPGEVEVLYPPYPEDRPVIVPHSSTHPNISQPRTRQRSADRQQIPPETLTRLLEGARQKLSDLDAFPAAATLGLGSNSWVISGDLTDTGKPYLANDPHLGQQIPSIWYEVGLHCQPQTEDCRLDVVGFSFAGVPGIVIGHNHRIAWGFTNVGPDVMDLYIEKLNPQNPDQYLFQGEWVDMEIIREEIRVAGGETVELKVRETHHGPIIGEVYGLEEFDQEAGIDLPEHYALAVRWTALEPSCVFCAIWNFNTADSWKDFRNAAREFAVPAQNLIYADVEGNIGYQMPGKIPIRSEGHDGMLPVPGWTGAYEWQGYIPFEELPHVTNPTRGYLVTANNAVVGPDYPYSITKQWSYGFRAQRIEKMIQEAPRPFTLETMQHMQGDNKDLLAGAVVPLLLDLELHNRGLIEARDLLSTWDFQADMASAPAALYMATWRHLLTATFEDDLPQDYQIGVDSTAKEVIRRMLRKADHPWWDDQRTLRREKRDDILRRALNQAYKELKRTQGGDPSAWTWGEMHTITFKHQVMDGFPLIKTAFNRGPFPTAGGNAIVNANGWSAQTPYHVDWVPSMRMIIDLSELNHALTINTTGQSGHPYHPHYIDKAGPWRQIQYHPMLWDWSQVEEQAEGTLRLVP